MNRRMRVLQTLALPLGYGAVLFGAGDGIAAQAVFRLSLSYAPFYSTRRLRRQETCRTPSPHPVTIHNPQSAEFATANESFFLFWSGRRDSDPRLSPWQGDTLPLSHSRALYQYIKRTPFWQPIFQNKAVRVNFCVCGVARQTPRALRRKEDPPRTSPLFRCTRRGVCVRAPRR